MGRGEAFSSHETIYSQSISEPVPLDCELYKCFSAFSPYLSGTRLLEPAEVGYFLFPGQWGFDNTPASRVLISFSWGQAAFLKKKKRRILWCISECFLFFTGCQTQRGFFFDIYLGNLVEFLGVNLTVCRRLLWPGAPGGFPRVVHTEPPASHHLQFRFSHSSIDFLGGFCWWISAQVSHSSLYSPVFIFWCSNFFFFLKRGPWFTLCLSLP